MCVCIYVHPYTRISVLKEKFLKRVKIEEFELRAVASCCSILDSLTDKWLSFFLTNYIYIYIVRLSWLSVKELRELDFVCLGVNHLTKDYYIVNNEKKKVYFFGRHKIPVSAFNGLLRVCFHFNSLSSLFFFFTLDTTCLLWLSIVVTRLRNMITIFGTSIYCDSR